MNTEPEKSKSMEIALGVLIVIGVIAAALIRIDNQRRGADQTEAYSNARSFGLALLEFDAEYGSFPRESTVSLVTEIYPAHGYDLSGNSSNAAFRQLIAGNITQSEQMFYAKTPSTHKPDGYISPGEALTKDEVGFAYISGLTSKDDPLTPLALTPLIHGTRKFDLKPFKGKAIILQIDNSVRSYEIHEDGHIYDKGIDLLFPKHPVWKGKAPDIRYPE